MAVYNVSKIEDWYNDFISCRKKFIDVYLDDYQNCYVKQCKDDITNMMRVSLNDNYNKINRLFNNINTYWNDYLNDLKNTDNYMAGTSSVGAINSSAVQAKLKTLPTLATYEVTLDIKTSSTITNTKNWWNNNKDTMAVYGMEIFCDVADLADQFGDGLFYAIGGAYTGVCTLIGAEDEATYTENWLKEGISLDWSSEIKESFYSSELGREINANSKVKYDSETMSNFSETFSKILDTGFAFLGQGLVGGIFGGVMGGGDAVESYLQENPDDSLKDAFTSALVEGIKKGSEYYAKGSLFKGGVSFLKGFKSIFTSGSGTKSLISTLSKAFTKEGAKQNLSGIGSKISQMFSKSNIVETLKLALKDPDTWLDSLGTASDHIKIDEKTGDVYVDDWKAFFEDASLGFLLNYIFKTGDVDVSSSGTSSSVMDELTNDLKRNYNLDEIDQKALSGKTKTSIKAKIDDVFSDIKKNFSDFKTTGQTKLSGAKSSVSDWFSGLRTNLDDAGSKISKKLSSILDDIKSNKLSNMVDDVITNTSTSYFNNDNLNINGSKINENPNQFSWDWSSKKEADALKNDDIPILEKYKVNTSSPEYQASWNNYKSSSGTEGLLGKENPFLKNKDSLNVSSAKSSLRNKIEDTFSNIKNSVDEFKTKSNTSFLNSKSKISDWFSNIRSNLDGTSSKLTSKFKSFLDDSNLKKSSDAVEVADNIIDEATYNQLLKKREELLAKTKQDWFIAEQKYMKNNNGMGTSNSVAYYNLTRQLDEINNTLKNNKVASNIEFSDINKIHSYDNNNSQFKTYNYMQSKIKSDDLVSNELKNKRIKDFENAFGLEYNNAKERKIIDSFERLSRIKSSDSNVEKIARNIESIMNEEPNFTFLINRGSTSAFWGPNKSVLLSENLLEHSTDVIGQTNMHEMGHAYLHIFNGDAKSGYKLILSKDTEKVIKDSMENLRNNSGKYIQYLKESTQAYDNAFDETIKWYNKIRPKEKTRIERLVDDLYSNNEFDALKEIISESENLQQVKNILIENGMSMSEIDDILSNKQLVKEIAVMQNNINMQQTHLEELMGSYNNYGDYRKISSIINSITQRTDHVDPSTGEKISCTYAHSDSYWTDDSLRRSYDELCADYFSLASHGRDNVINTMEEILGTKLMNSIKEEYKKIAVILEKKGLIKY